jgi:glucose-1-phosphate cytidylyltransferase
MIKDYFRNYLWMTSDVTLQLGRQPNIKFHNHHKEEDWTVTLADTGQETLTGGRIARIKQFIGDDPDFFLTYGDGVGNVDIPATLEFHRCNGKVLTLCAVRPPGRFGELQIGKDGQVEQFIEKPQVAGGRINGGFFVASRRVFDYLQGNCDQVIFEQGPIRKIAADKQMVAYQHDGFWQPMDTIQEFTLLNKMWAEGSSPWKNWE